MYTRELAESVILSSLRQNGYTPKLIGSVATIGHSKKDIDILIPDSEMYLDETDPDQPIDQFNHFVKVMDDLGFTYVDCYENPEHEEWGIFHSFYKKDTDIGIDVFIGEIQ